jgi:alkylhydroperoxidase/carboxymuconolactone decarboxylase family protein YurZ
LNFITQIKQLQEVELLALLSTASVLRKEKYFAEILKIMLHKKISQRKIYEALLQTYLFAGFPSALISLKKFNEVVCRGKKYDGYDLRKYSNRGIKNCRKIYGSKFDKLISNIKTFSPEMAEWLIVEGYGKVLGRKGLTLKEREVCIVSILSALKYKDQLYSHINGAIRVKVEYHFLYKIIANLQFISAKSSGTFGLNILNAYRLQKNKFA